MPVLTVKKTDYSRWLHSSHFGRMVHAGYSDLHGKWTAGFCDGYTREAGQRESGVVGSEPAGPALPKEPSMKCKVKVGELRDALQMAAITVDRRQGSELGYVHLGLRKGKAGNQRIILNSTDGIGRFLIRVPCEVEETGDLVIEPIRLSSLLDRRQEDELVVFAQDKTTNRVVARCGSAKVTML